MMGMRWLTVAAMLLVMGGCSTAPNVESWQRRLEEYVLIEGDGDATALRNVPAGSDRKGFSVFSHKNPAESNDVNGLLLAHRVIEGRPWFIYMVGNVKKLSVGEMRLAAVCCQGGEFQWAVGEGNEQSVKKYREAKEAVWRRVNRDGDMAEARVMNFPGDGDVFNIQITGGRVVAMDQRSGAQWELALPGAAAGSAAAASTGLKQ